MSYVFSGWAGLTLLLLHPETRAICNRAGDALTAAANGLFTATVTEAITGYWRVVVLDGSVALAENEWILFKSDVEGVYVVGDPVIGRLFGAESLKLEDWPLFVPFAIFVAHNSFTSATYFKQYLVVKRDCVQR